MRYNKIYRYRYGVKYKQPIPYHTYSFISIVRAYYDLPIVITKRVEFILQKVGNNYSKYFYNIPYEKVVLGVTLFAVDEFNSRRINYNTVSFDVDDYITKLYGVEKLKFHTRQVYYVKSIVQHTLI